MFVLRSDWSQFKLNKLILSEVLFEFCSILQLDLDLFVQCLVMSFVRIKSIFNVFCQETLKYFGNYKDNTKTLASVTLYCTLMYNKWNTTNIYFNNEIS